MSKWVNKNRNLECQNRVTHYGDWRHYSQLCNSGSVLSSWQYEYFFCIR